MRIALLFALLTLSPAIAQAAESCAPPRLLDTIQMTRGAHGAVDMAPVRVNGTAENFIFDTGGFYSQVSPATAAALHLPVHPSGRILYDVRGTASRNQAEADSFALGTSNHAHMMLQLSPNIGAFEGEPIDGLLALDMLGGADLDIDFGADILKLFAPDHCPGTGVTWGPPAMAAVPIARNSGYITVQVVLGGHAIEAILDTGASDTALTEDAARKIFGLVPGDTATPRYGELNGAPGLPTYIHYFPSLTFGQVDVGEPGVLVIPQGTRNRLDVSGLVIGMDVLRHLHVYMAMAEHKMYVTPASQ